MLVGTMQTLHKFLKHPSCVVYTTPQICTITRNIFPRPRPTNVEGVNNNDDGGASSDDQRGIKCEGGNPHTLRLLVQSKAARNIAGKNDENLRRLESQFVGAHVTLPKLFQNSSEIDLGRRILTISADQKDQCVGVLKECLPLVQIPPYPVGTESSHAFEIDLLVPSSGCGSIIGAGGKHIKKLHKKNNTPVNIYQDCLPASNERVLALGGSGEDDIVTAVKKIMDKIELSPAKGGGSTTLYDPLFDESLEPLVKETRGRGRRKEKSRDNVSAGAQPTTDKRQPTKDGSRRTTDGGRQTKQMSVRVNLVGTIIGKGAELLKVMQQESGADIVISGREERGKTRLVINSKYRLVTISGREDQVRHAEKLINELLQEHLHR